MILPETGDVMAAAAEGAKVGSATPDGQCLGDVSGLFDWNYDTRRRTSGHHGARMHR